MTSIVAEAHVRTEQGRRYLADLCRTLEEKVAARPGVTVIVESTETDGTIDFGWARCSLHADTTALVLRADAEDESALRQVCELITRHLERHAGDEKLTVMWQHDGEALTHDDRDRRDNMRAFHRRMRDH